MPEHITPAATDAGPSEADQQDQPTDQSAGVAGGWAGAMAQIDAEIAELQALLAKRREAAERGEDPDSDSAA